MPEATVPCSGEGFCITQRGEPVADLLPVGTSMHRSGAEAARRMRLFMRDSSQSEACDIKALLDEDRD